ncbi:MAG: tRNA (N6-isopentenyl adenosine(37)-C2)-methylthiotransferase MiaB [Patescibacteria group bacterium]
MSGFYHITTFGCQMNKNDSERLSALLNSLGLQNTIRPEQADLLFINTCSVRQHAEDRVFGLVREWQKLRSAKPNLIIGVTGCMPGRDKDGKLKEKIPGADLFFGIEEMVMLPKWIRGLNPDLIAPAKGLSDYLLINPVRENKAKAFITIATGCNNFCTYCVVPYARGREKNRPAKDILNEIKTAAVDGCKEVTLLGQTVNNYKDGDYDFVDLLEDVNKISGIERINWTAPDPQYFNDRQIEALKLPKQMNYLHLPAQSGDNEILRKMNRKYTREDYINLVKKIRAARPEIALGTDLIVGFCGETEEQFQNTLDLYKQCDFDISYHAMYSSRSGTAAAKAFKDDVLQEEKKRRWRAVQDLMEEIVYRKNQKYLNQTVSVLVDSCEEGVCSGNSSEMKLVQFPGNEDLIGQIIDVKITRPEMWVLRGVLV